MQCETCNTTKDPIIHWTGLCQQCFLTYLNKKNEPNDQRLKHNK